MADVSPFAGKVADPALLVDVARLVAAYYTERPDPFVPEERVSFGTSGHRGSSLTRSFNEAHVLAISQAICRYRSQQGIDGPLFLGIDTHALSEPAFRSALEVLAANDVAVQISVNDEYTPTPAVSHAILTYNRGRKTGLADGIVVTPSHNPPEDGGFKYNPPHGGPAGSEITGFIERQANELMARGLGGVNRVIYEQALARRPPTATIFSMPTSPTWTRSSISTSSAAPGSGSPSIHSAAPACATGERSPSDTASI